MKVVTYPPAPIKLEPERALPILSGGIASESLHEPRLFWGNATADAEEILETPLWGTFVPVTAGHCDLRIMTPALPLGTVASAQWRATDGSAEFSTDPVPAFGQDPIIVPLPEHERRQFEGKEADVTYTLRAPDGLVAVSPARLIKVTRFLSVTPPEFEGVEDDGLHVPNYPDGLTVKLGPVGNGELFQRISCNWGIYIIDGGSMIGLYNLIQHLPYSPGESYEFWIPSFAYTGFPQGAFCQCYCGINLLPYPSSFGWGLGGKAFDLLQN